MRTVILMRVIRCSNLFYYRLEDVLYSILDEDGYFNESD